MTDQEKLKEIKLDPFCVEKNLHSWASSRIVARGRDYYRMKRVLTLEFYDDNRILAQVEGMAEEPYRVEIKFDQWGMPLAQCSCPFKWEPLCKHVVATLIAWQQQETGSEPLLGPYLPETKLIAPATDITERNNYIQELARLEREARRVRCQEQGLRILHTPGDGPFGAYTVSSGSPTRNSKSYQVIVRDAMWQHASCDCLDFRTNEVGTCKHIELVRRSLERKIKTPKFAALEDRLKRISIYLACRETHSEIFHPTEEIRFYIPPVLGPELEPLLSRALDEQGYLRVVRDPVGQKNYLKKLLQRLASRLDHGCQIDMEPQVDKVLSAQAEAYLWERRIESIAKAANSHPVWKNSIGSMRIQFHPYQLEGIVFAARKRQAFIGDDMGLGKTVQAIGLALLLKEMGAVKRTLVITPASLKFQWQREIQKVCDASVTIISGGIRERNEQYRKAREFFLLVNYELLYRDLPAIMALNADLVILDEAQRIKNWQTKIAQTIKKFQSPFRLVLTGTPLENRLSELHSITEFLNPRALGAAWKLIPTYAELDNDDKIIGYSRLDHLRSRLSKFLLRRNRSDVLSQLPKRTDNNYWTPMTTEQCDVHDGFAGQVQRLIKKLERFKRLTQEDIQLLFRLLTCMRIVSNAYGQYDWKTIEHEVLTAKRLSMSLKKKIGSPKLDEFCKVLSDLLEIPGQKVVVFSQWERMLRLAELYARDIFETSGSQAVIFCGSLSLKRRDAEIKRFIEDPKTRVFFSTDSGGLGLNLQEGSNCVINLEIPWNPAVMEQRIGRVHRMGQKKSVQVINFISAECIESRIFDLVAQKKALFSELFSGEAKEISFNQIQKASFIDKLKMVVPTGKADDSSPLSSDATKLEAAADSVSRTSSGGNGNGANIAVSKTRPVFDVDLGPVVSSLSNMLQATQGGISRNTDNLKVKVSEDEDGIHVTFPKPALEFLQPFQRLLETFLKLMPGSGPEYSKGNK